METIHCNTYNIFFNDWTSLVDKIKGNYSRIVVIVDENTETHCLPIFKSHIETPYYTIAIPAGESFKNLNTAKYIWEEMVEAGCDRHSLCINLGGGVIGDMGGWTAASYMRGMDFIQVPTTLLAMVDASVGGKLAIDFHSLKNLIGLIKDPNAVFIFPEFLKTLSSRLIKSGMAEVLKHGLIIDRDYWNDVKDHGPKDETEWDNWIYKSVLIKKDITEKDPYEKNLRKILNFGHTLGHAIESYSLDNDEDPLTHGEAIAIGMICEAHMSNSKGLLSEEDLNEITSGLTSIFGKESRTLASYDALKKSLFKDKKNIGGTVMYSLLNSIGDACYNMEVSEADVLSSMQYYNNL